MLLKAHLPEPSHVDQACVAGRDEPEEKPPPNTQEGLRKLAEQRQPRQEKNNLAFTLNWSVTEPEEIDKVVDQCWQLEETGRDLWNQCEKLRELILAGVMPTFSCEDRKRMSDTTEQLMVRGDWQIDPGSTYRRRIQKKPSPKCIVPTEDVHAYFRKVWNPDARPENTFIPPDSNSPRYIRPQETDDTLQSEISFIESMRAEVEVRKCLMSKHNLSELGLDGVGYCHLERGGDPMIKLLAAIFADCDEHRKVPSARRCSRIAFLYKK
jgi:hypothetical protein